MPERMHSFSKLRANSEITSNSKPEIIMEL